MTPTTTTIQPVETGQIRAADPVGAKALGIRTRDDGDSRYYMDRELFEQAWSVANVLAKTSLIPSHLRGKVEDCFVLVQLAFRIRQDPLAVMQACYVVHGKPGFESKFIIGLVNSSGLFENPLQFRFSGDRLKADWTCTAWAKRAGTGELCEMPLRWETVVAEGWLQKDGSKWRTMPDQMMRYRAATFFCNVYCPEVKFGFATREELEDIPEIRGVEVLPATVSRTEALAQRVCQPNDGNGSTEPVAAIASLESDAMRAESAGGARSEAPSPDSDSDADPPAESEPKVSRRRAVR